MNSNATNNYVHRAVVRGHNDVLKILLSRSVPTFNVNGALNRTGFQALHFASKHGHTDIVRTLLAARDADANTKGTYDIAPLHFAADEGHADVVRILLAANVDVNASSEDGITALHLAAARGRRDVVKTLLSVSAIEVDNRDAFGDTPLQRAVNQAHDDIVNMLEQHCSEV